MHSCDWFSKKNRRRTQLAVWLRISAPWTVMQLMDTGLNCTELIMQSSVMNMTHTLLVVTIVVCESGKSSALLRTHAHYLWSVNHRILRVYTYCNFGCFSFQRLKQQSHHWTVDILADVPSRPRNTVKTYTMLKIFLVDFTSYIAYADILQYSVILLYYIARPSL